MLTTVYGPKDISGANRAGRVTRSEIQRAAAENRNTKDTVAFESRLDRYEGENSKEILESMKAARSSNVRRGAGKGIVGMVVGTIGAAIETLAPGLSGVLGGGLIKMGATYMVAKGVYDPITKNYEIKRDEQRIKTLHGDEAVARDRINSQEESGFETRLASFEGDNADEITTSMKSRKWGNRLKGAGKMALGFGLITAGAFVAAAIPGVGGVLAGGAIQATGAISMIKSGYETFQDNKQIKADLKQLKGHAEEALSQRRLDNAWRQEYIIKYPAGASPALMLRNGGQG